MHLIVLSLHLLGCLHRRDGPRTLRTIGELGVWSQILPDPCRVRRPRLLRWNRVRRGVDDERAIPQRRSKLNYRDRRRAVWIVEEGVPFLLVHWERPLILDVLDPLFGRPVHPRLQLLDALSHRRVQLHRVLGIVLAHRTWPVDLKKQQPSPLMVMRCCGIQLRGMEAGVMGWVGRLKFSRLSGRPSCFAVSLAQPLVDSANYKY